MQTYTCAHTNMDMYTHKHTHVHIQTHACTHTIVILLFVHSGTDKEHPGDLKISCGDEGTNACRSTVPVGGMLLLPLLLSILVKGGAGDSSQYRAHWPPCFLLWTGDISNRESTICVSLWTVGAAGNSLASPLYHLGRATLLRS